MQQPPGSILPNVPVRFDWRGRARKGVVNEYYPGGGVLLPGYYIIATDERGQCPTYYLSADEVETLNPDSPRWPD